MPLRWQEQGASYDACRRALLGRCEAWMVGFTPVPAYKYRQVTAPLAYQSKGCPLQGRP